MEEIYLGSWEVKFSSVGGKFQEYNHSNTLYETTSVNAQQRKYPFVTSNEQKHKILLAAIPSIDLYQKEEENSENSPFSSNLSSNLSSFLRHPKVKSENGEIKGIRSGGRSAIIQIEDKIYRLKGCGNYVDQENFRHQYPGFPLRPLEICGEVIADELRGCSFPYLSIREMYFCEELAKIMKKFHNADDKLEEVVVGNVPVGQWLFDFSSDPLDGNYEAFEGIQMSCSIFETKGEKRISSHFLYGAEQLIEKFGIISSKESLIDLENILKNRPNSDPDLKSDLETWKACSIGDNPSSPIQIVDSSLFYVNLDNFDQFDKLIAENFNEEVTSAWRDSLSLLKSFYSSNNINNNINLFALLYWRIGREVGEVVRILKENDVMWGYFFDHNPFEPHCNSHLNNFILLLPHFGKGGKERRFTAPLDFDMTFDRKSFFSPYTNEADDELFDDWKRSEINEMERCIGGDIANNGLDTPQVNSTLNLIANNDVNGEFLNVFKYSLRDTMLSAFRSAYNNEEDKFAGDYKIEYDEVLQAFITLSLTFSHFRQS